MDITLFMTWFIDMFINLFKFIYNTLDTITFNNISLLQYTISIFVLFPILTLLFTLVTSRNVYDNIEKRHEKNRKEKAKEND